MTINTALGKLGSVEWPELPEDLSSPIVLTGSVSPLAKRDWPFVFEWLLKAYQSVVDVLDPIVPWLDPAYSRVSGDDGAVRAADVSKPDQEPA